jgi:hypothetical protein
MGCTVRPVLKRKRKEEEEENKICICLQIFKVVIIFWCRCGDFIWRGICLTKRVSGLTFSTPNIYQAFWKRMLAMTIG